MKATRPWRKVRSYLTAFPLLAALAMLLSACYWQPSDDTGTVSVSARDLSGDSRFRVRFFAGDDLEDSVFPIGGEFAGVGYPDGLPPAARIGARTQYMFSVTGESGEILISGVPADIPYQVLVERIGTDEFRLGEVSAEYEPSAEFLTYAGISPEAFEVKSGQTERVEVVLEQAALSTIKLVDPDGEPLYLLDNLPYFELVAAPEDTRLVLTDLLLEDQAFDIETSELNAWYEDQVRARGLVLRPLPTTLPREPAEEEGNGDVDDVIIRAVLPGKRIQVIVTDYGEGRFHLSPGQPGAFGYEGNSGSVGVSDPFTLAPGATPKLAITAYEFGQFPVC